MGLVDRKGEWLRARIAELNDDGIRDAQLAKRMGKSKSEFSRQKHAIPPGDDFIDLFSATFRKPFTMYDGEGDAAPSEAKAEAGELTQTLEGLLRRSDSMASLMLEVLAEMRAMRGVEK